VAVAERLDGDVVPGLGAGRAHAQHEDIAGIGSCIPGRGHLGAGLSFVRYVVYQQAARAIGKGGG